jgi:hypothetical protein
MPFNEEKNVLQGNTFSKKKKKSTSSGIGEQSNVNKITIKTLAASSNNATNELSVMLEGAKLTITDPHLSVDSAKFPDALFKKPTTYSKQILKVENGKNLIIPPYKITRRSDGQQRSVPLSNFSFTISYEKVVPAPDVDEVFKKSYADIQFRNLRTFSGDVYKAKIFTKEKGSQGDFEKIADVVLDAQNQLVDKTGATGFEHIGLFYTSSIIDNSWVSSSNQSSASINNTYIAAGALLSGSNEENGSDFTFVTSGSYDLQRNEDYIVSFDTYFFKENKKDSNGDTTKQAELEVFLTGSAISPSSTGSEYSLGVVDNTFEGMKNKNDGQINNVFNYFKTHNKRVSLPNTKLGFRVKSGRFVIANVSLEPFAEKNFNPQSFRTLIPMPKPVKRGQRFDFFTEFYDYNNNKADFEAQTSASIVFDGAPQIIADGTDAVLTGSVFLGSTQGQGIELHGGSAYMRSLGYNGFDRTIGENLGGFMIFSGSVSQSINTSQSYDGVGLEIVDAHGDTDRFLKFRTNPSEFTVQTDQFFFGKEGQFISGSNGNIVISSSNFFLGDDNAAFISGSNGNINISSSNFFLGGGSSFISGSNGNIEITSSNFHLDNDGSVTMAGEITAEAGGTIGGWDIGTNTISDLNASGKGIELKSDASTPIITIKEDSNNKIELFHTTTNNFGLIGTSGGSVVFRLGSTNQIGGFGITATAVSSSNNNLILKNSGQITGSTVLFSGGKIGGFDLTSNSISSSNNNLRLKDNGQITGSDVLFDGGDIGGFSITNNSISSSNNKLRLKDSGQITGSDVLFSGGEIGGFLITDNTIETSDFVSGLKGIRLSTANNGSIEAEEAKIRGTLKTTVFEKESVNAVGGQLIVANSTAITGSDVAKTDTTMSVENVTGFAPDEILLIKKISGSGFSTEYVQVISSSLDFNSDTNFQGKLMVSRSFGSSATYNPSLHSGSITTTTATGSTYTPGQVIVSTGKVNTGFIKLNANPNDSATPFIDIVERTGSGVFDVDLKARLGDLSGLSSGLVGSSPGFGLFSENVFLTGKITATSGEIGGFGISDNSVSSSNNNIILRDSGQLTASNFLFSGGRITSGVTIEGTVSADTILTPATQSGGGANTIEFASSSIDANGNARFRSGSIGGLKIDTGSLFIGTGEHGDSNTSFFVNADGQFSLKDKLVWDGSSLSIDGTISVGSMNGAVSGAAQIAADISGSSVSASNSATTTGEKGISDAGLASSQAAAAQNAVDTLETQLLLTSDGVKLLDNSNVAVANFGTNVIIGTTGSNEENVFIDSDSVDVRSGTDVLSSFGSTTTIGNTSTEHMKISGSGLEFKSGSVSKFQIHRGGVQIGSSGGGISFDLNGNATFNGSIAIGSMNGSVSSSAQIAADISGSAVSGASAAMGTAATGVSGSAAASADAATGIANAATAQAAVDEIETQLVLTNDGVKLLNNSSVAVANFGTTLVIGTTGSNEENVLIDNDSVDIRSGTSALASFGSTTTIGDTSGEHISIDANSIDIKTAANVTVMSASADGIEMSGSIKAGSGEIGGWTIGSSTLTGGSVTLDSAGTVNATGQTAATSKTTTAQLSGSNSDGSSLTIKRQNIDNSAEIDIIKVNTDQVYGDETDYTTNKDKVAMTMTGGSGAQLSAQQTVSGSDGADAWNGSIFIRADSSSDLDEVELATSMASNEMLDSGEANNVVELSFSNFLVSFTDLDGGTNKAQFQYKLELFQNDTNASASAELVSSYRFSDVLTQAQTSGLNIPNAIINKRFFFLQLTGTGYDEINSTHADGNVFKLQYSGTPIAGTRFLPKVNVTGLGFQTFAGANQHVTFGADNKIVGDMYIRKTSAATRGNMFVQGNMAVGGLAIDDDNELFVDGNIAATGNITAFFTSDERLKNNVVRIEDGLSIVNQLRPVSFEWDEKSPYYHDKFRDYGLIAQEVEKVLPNVVGHMKDGYKGIKYEKIIPFLIDSIQQLTKRVEELEDK